MRFALNDEQIALQDAVKDFVSKRSTSEVIRQAITCEVGYDKELYQALCQEMGLASILVPQELGGFGATDVELAVIQEILGYHLAPTPFRAHVFSQIALLECASDEFRSEHLAELAGGDKLATILNAEETSKEGLKSISREEGAQGVVLSATLSQVPFGFDADHLYVFVGKEKELLFIDLNQDGINRSMTPSIDQTIPLAKIELTGVFAKVLSSETTRQNYDRAISRSIIALSNEMVGSSQALLDMSVQYAKDRKQFGRAIGSFQAIKHKCADMLLETESSRSIALYAAWLASQGEDFSIKELEDDLSHVAAMSKYYCSKTFSHAAGETIQIHGGIGFTMEHDAQLYFKRAAFMNAYLGLPHEHARKVASKL